MAEPQPVQRQETEVFPTEVLPGATSADVAEPPQRSRDVDPVPLVVGLLFIALAVLFMSGVDVSLDWFGRGIAWVLLIGAGILLLLNELRKSRRRR